VVDFQTIIASKGARVTLAAHGEQLVDSGLRRAHGAETGLLAARTRYLGGFARTAKGLAGHDFGIPIVGTGSLVPAGA
jgi:nicotinate phosphoribosyltransferase